ncbi:TatD family hydrolase [Shewanella olleyana]|uniref:TatD family hydrolase n=1 Tax=Shewanella olleyana TaxID=135626 RepID=UPI00200F013B|nr:TatD family hydrolase [Shewanella olleyana]MCL1066607.1 TatD family hydrolase [Shewanella olleyana]
MIDTHAHLDLDDFDHDRHALFKEMHELGITSAIIPGISEHQWQRQIAIATEFNCYFALGIHPWYLPQNIEDSLTLLEQKISEQQGYTHFVALGECGLDKLKPNFTMQLELLSGQLKLANQFNLPVILHAVKCHQELCDLLAKHPNPKGGVIHGFYGGPELAQRYINLGYKLGIGGLVMNPDAKKLRKTITELDIKYFLIETDSPSMTPSYVTEKRNTPLHLPKFVSEIADLQKKTTVFILEQLNRNAVQLFEL